MNKRSDWLGGLSQDELGRPQNGNAASSQQKPVALTEEQQERLKIVMDRDSVGTSHLDDRCHLGQMPNYRPNRPY
jgi:hypothetical protein